MDPPPTAPQALRAAIVAVERRALDPAQAESAGRQQQALYRAAALAGWGLSDVDPPAELAARIEHLLLATRAIVTLTPSKATQLPAWTLRPAPPLDQVRRWLEEAAEAHRVPWSILASIYLVESRMGRLVGPSSAGARGPMQFMPATWAQYGAGADIEDDRAAIDAAGRYLAASGAQRDLDRALWAYNHSDHYVKAIRGYARALDAEPDLLGALRGWEVNYRTARGLVRLPSTYRADAPLNLDLFCGEHPGCCAEVRPASPAR
jgi:hypothetical protein